MRSPRPTDFSASVARSRRAAAVALPPYSSGSSTFSSADVRDSRLNPWKTKPISVLPHARERARRQLRDILAVEEVTARSSADRDSRSGA